MLAGTGDNSAGTRVPKNQGRVGYDGVKQVLI